MTVCKSAVLLHYINYNSAVIFFSVFFSMAFDRCSINDYLLTYILTYLGACPPVVAGN